MPLKTFSRRTRRLSAVAPWGKLSLRFPPLRHPALLTQHDGPFVFAFVLFVCHFIIVYMYSSVVFVVVRRLSRGRDMARSASGSYVGDRSCRAQKSHLSRPSRPNSQRDDTRFAISGDFAFYLPPLHRKPATVIPLSVAFTDTTDNNGTLA